MINKRKQYNSSLSIVQSFQNLVKDDSPVNTNRKKQLSNVYHQLMKNFDRQASKIKLETIHATSNATSRQDSGNRRTKSIFDDQGLTNANFVRGSKERSSRSIIKNKMTLPKFYQEKIVSDNLVYIHEKKQISQLQNNSEFKKLSFPQATSRRSNNIANLSQRNKKLLSLCKNSQLQQIKKKQQKQKSSDLETMQNSLPLKKSGIAPLPLQFPSKKKKQLTMEQVLRQAQRRRQQRTNKNLNYNSNMLININTYDLEIQSLQIHSQETTEDSPNKFGTDDPSKCSRSPSMHIKNSKKIMPYSQRSNYISLKVKKRTFNWKNANMPLNKVQKHQIIKLFQKYLGIEDVISPHIGHYKIYIGEGNNSVLIWRTLKAKGYWTLVQSIDENPNLVWTQSPNKKFKNLVTTKYEIQNSQDRNEIEFSNKGQELSKIPETQIASFLKIKNNEYFETIKKVYGPQFLSKIQSQIISKFKNERKVNDYQKLWETIKRYLKIDCSEFLKANQIRMHNHLQNSDCIGNKKSLLYYMKQYAKIFNEDVNQYIPETIHLEAPISDQDININQENVLRQIPQGPWLVKPGQSTNRGKGITIHTSSKTMLQEISRKKTHKNGQDQTYIVQKYIMPMLYNERKFDIRVWVLWTGNQLWWYDQGYLRTASKQFTLKSLNKFIHLTNDAVQSTCQDYGKYQPGNKLSFGEFQRYLQLKQLRQKQGVDAANYQVGHQIKPQNDTFKKIIYPKMKQLAVKVFRIGSTVIDNSKHSFELFGLDYLVDANNKVWLIEVNNNPSLEICCSLLARLIPNMIDNLCTIAIDPYFPPPQKKNHRDAGLFSPQSFHFQLIYDNRTDKQIKQYRQDKSFRCKSKSQQLAL